MLYIYILLIGQLYLNIIMSDSIFYIKIPLMYYVFMYIIINYLKVEISVN